MASQSEVELTPEQLAQKNRFTTRQLLGGVALGIVLSAALYFGLGGERATSVKHDARGGAVAKYALARNVMQLGHSSSYRSQLSGSYPDAERQIDSDVTDIKARKPQ